MSSHIYLFILQLLFTVVGIIGNSWVIVAILRYNAIKRTSNKILFINLAIADMGVLIIRNPFYFLLIYSHNRWLFGEFACRILLPFSLMFMPASVLTVVAIWYSRCSAIVKVRQLNEISNRTAWYTVVAIWTFVAAFYPIIEIPVRKVNTTAQSCDLDVSAPVSYSLYALEDLYFVAAFFVIVAMFIRMRRSLLSFSEVYNNNLIVKKLMKNMKALKLLWPVVIVLFVCMLPLAVGRTWQWIIGDDNDTPLYFLHIIDVLLVTNSAVNPYLYIIVSTEFRQKFWQIPCVKFLQVRFAKSRLPYASGTKKSYKSVRYPNVKESNV